MAEDIKNDDQDKNVDIQAELEKARKQERDKLHADMERLKNEIAEKAKTCNENYITISNLRKELETAKKSLDEVDNRISKAKEDGKVEVSKDLEAVKAELEEYKNKLAKAEKEFADYKVAEETKAYRATKLTDIEEEFKELVKGDTKEEIDASYEKVKSLQETVKEKYGKKENQQKNTLPNPKQQNKTPKSLDDLLKKFNSMTPEEYAEARKKNFK